MLARAVIKTINDDTNIQQMSLSILSDELRDKIERYQNYGFTSVPLPGMEAFVGFIAGDRGNPVIIAVGDRRFRVKGLKQGEVAIYTDEGDKIHFKRGREIEVTTDKCIVNAARSAEVNAEKIDINGSQYIALTAPDIFLNGNVTGGGSGSVKFNASEFSINADHVSINEECD